MARERETRMPLLCVYRVDTIKLERIDTTESRETVEEESSNLFVKAVRQLL
jgi:hypothetical protein